MNLFFLILLLLLLWVWIGRPLWRYVRSVRRMQREFSRMFSGQPFEREAESRPGGWSAGRPAKRKKIDRDTGEYVSFEELDVEVSEPQERSAVRPEQQVSDAEWEEI